jgi:hypothetical protein
MPNPDYRKMFEDLAPYYPEPDDLGKLATIMSGRTRFIDAENNSELFNKDEMEVVPEIPSGYTYLAQFISHDISFEEDSDRHVRRDRPWGIMDPELIKNLRNLRKPNFDLETIYGYENPTNRGETSRDELITEIDEFHPLPLLKLGDTKGNSVDGGTAALSYPHDLPRGLACVEARIVDSRNDENLLLAQTQAAFIKFHNAMVVNLSESKKYQDESGQVKTKELFDKARKLTIRYYQTIILRDFLPRIVQKSVLDDVTPAVNTRKLFYQPDLFIPLEFSVAAFRFGHSMIRDKYNLNVRHFDSSVFEDSPAETSPALLRDLTMFTGRGAMNSTPLSIHLKLPSIWIIDWNLFYELDGSIFTSLEKIRNIAQRINTDLPIELLRLRPRAENDPEGRASSLAALDLFRGRRFGLPTGQDVATKIGATPLSAEEIGNLIMRKAVVGAGRDDPQKIKERLHDVFGKKTPLWFYVLAEAELQGSGKLGVVGSRIIAETIIQLLYHSEYSILRHDWEEDEGFLLNGDGSFRMPEMLKFVQRMGQEHFNKLYPNNEEYFDDLNPLGKG